jgi:hypothetical protein
VLFTFDARKGLANCSCLVVVTESKCGGCHYTLGCVARDSLPNLGNFHRREEDTFFGAADAGWGGVLTLMLTDYCLLRSSEGELGEVEGTQIE